MFDDHMISGAVYNKRPSAQDRFTDDYVERRFKWHLEDIETGLLNEPYPYIEIPFSEDYADTNVIFCELIKELIDVTRNDITMSVLLLDSSWVENKVVSIAAKKNIEIWDLEASLAAILEQVEYYLERANSLKLPIEQRILWMLKPENTDEYLEQFSLLGKSFLILEKLHDLLMWLLGEED